MLALWYKRDMSQTRSLLSIMVQPYAFEEPYLSNLEKPLNIGSAQAL